MVTPRIPEKPSLDGLEAKWSKQWESDGTYHFDRTKERGEVYSIDTPPPTVSGSLHTGHVFSYSQTDMVARFWRMRGKAVFYPIGWDDNGLATERRVQNYYGVRCDPSQAFVPDYEPPETPPQAAVPISRPNFVELCRRLTESDEQIFEDIHRRLGLSYDWRHQYTTIGERARRISQIGFLRMLERDEAYRHEAPTLWDVDFRTAVAQAELEDREQQGAYYRVAFARADGDGPPIEIETTRPELIPACVALVAHPSDERYQALFGTDAVTPLFGVRVPIVAHHLAEPEKGSGIAMICTFGDTTDVTWWRELSLPTRTVVQRDGLLGEAPFGEPGWESTAAELARTNYAELQGKNPKQAQRRIVQMLAESGALVGEPRLVTHFVKFYERGERPLEIVSSPQWYVRTIGMRARLLERGRELIWHPEFMRARYESWVEGLTGDWNISRQRFFGVPFPVWYRLDDAGEVMPGELLLPGLDRLPIDPSTDVPEGFSEAERGEPRGFLGDPDVMDTWATSSLTPQIAGGWVDDPDLFARVFPTDLRPQAHDIIRTWLFATIVRSELEHDALPWRHAAISGWILDPDRKKMSKSKGNVVVPVEPLDRYGTDAVRYWAAAARLGVDTAYDEHQMTVGRRLAIKVLNVTKFVLGRLGAETAETPEAAITEPVDAAMLAYLAGVVTEATAAFARYDHARALEVTESFFWAYCDDYVELVKARAYGEGAEAAASESARTALATSLGVLLRAFAPFLPFCTEETWSWWHDRSVHLEPWPEAASLVALAGAEARAELFSAVSEVLGPIRRAKSEAHRGMRAPVASCLVSGRPDQIALLELARHDLMQAGTISELRFVPDAGLAAVAVDVELAPEAHS
ncbi:MAG TPA: valine--tRNA ligase [Acidimicrobiales bacterium]|nr:valine--tRNA ligase [Acidimicrobiales bacterium]